MRVIENYDEIKASSGEFERPGNGGYILEIVNVTDVPFNKDTGKGDYLRIDYDIAHGDFKGYYTKQNERFGGGKWFANVIKSYKEKALGMFKHFTNCIEESNPGFKWNWQEDKLIGCRFGATLQEEEYLNNDGEVRTKMVIKDIKTVKQIMDGDFKVPTTKKLERSNAMPAGYATPNYPDFAAINDEDAQLPF